MTKRTTRSVSKKANDKTGEHTYEHGKLEGRLWQQAAHPNDVKDAIESLGWWDPHTGRMPWRYCEDPLRSHLESRGRAYTFGFADAIRNAFQAVAPALAYIRHHEGVEDGRRWASEFATETQFSRLRDFARDPQSRDTFLGLRGEHAAEELVAYLVDSTYATDDEREVIDCVDFPDFWQPFVNQPMDEVMALLKRKHTGIRHKLQDGRYIAGFVDGALGLSEQLRQGLRRLASPQSPTDAHDGGK